MPENLKRQSKNEWRAPKLGDAGIKALDDDELDAVIGGYQVVFRESGVSRDSWFVSYMTRRMIQDSIRQEMNASSGSFPGEISVRGRAYRLTQTGDQIFVEEMP